MTTADPQAPVVDLPIDNKVKQVVSNIRNLPTPPIVFHQIQKVINDPKVSAAQIAAILSEDPAMSVKVLKLTNSAFYGLSREIESVKQAVVVVGMEAIKNLVLSASILDMFKGKEYDQDFQDLFWRHSLATAFGSRMLAKKIKSRGFVDPDAAFSAGLLHDIGKIIIACYLPGEWKKLSEARQADSSLMDHDLEQQVLGYDHAQIGALLAGQWKLPRKLAEAIIHHHHPDQASAEDPICYIVHIADNVAKVAFYDHKDNSHRIGVVSEETQQYMGIDPMALAGYVEDLKVEYVKAETFMKMAGMS